MHPKPPRSLPVLLSPLHKWLLAGYSVPNLKLPDSFRQLKTVDRVERIKKQLEFLIVGSPLEDLALGWKRRGWKIRD